MPKILVADDSIAVRKVAERLLTEAGLGVMLAANGEEAMAVLSKERPDLIVSDVIMPDKSGYEVCAFVRSQAALSDTPVLLISGIVNDEVTRQAESCKADGVLKKPFQGTLLKDRVLDLLSRRPQRDAAATPVMQAAAHANGSVAASSVKPAEPRKAPDIDQTQLDALRQAAARLGEAEAALRTERERTAQLVQRIAELERESARMKELEAQLAAEQERSAILEKRATDAELIAGRVQELEATLSAERDAAAQLVQQLNEIEPAARRAGELEASLAAERRQAAELSQRLADAQRQIQRMGELDAALAAERERVAQLSRRVVEAESTAGRVKELEALLATERGRVEQAMKRASDSELAAQQANKRLEDMARKLAEIAGLASQLGNGKSKF
jgi:CheY-like chemotaxis protein